MRKNGNERAWDGSERRGREKGRFVRERTQEKKIKRQVED